MPSPDTRNRTGDPHEHIVLLEAQLAAEYAKRAGTMDSLGNTWCCLCGERRVFPERGEDTCPSCVRSI